MLHRRWRADWRTVDGGGCEADGASRRLVCAADPGAITPVVGYLLAIIAGTLVAGLSYAFLKRPEEAAVAKAA